ncbi:Alpha/Beta hydrolase protein [Achaetomium macrosporum]|uniref:Alpha/Beta hydrolase protein n=1 Tax=Achaetomium macrosporum TaxID=79813 RepID=A0AAN7C0L9_9PEZI|nr:Alpha/Beta hydrolase protein [Achaetomium macrosporum]
MAAVTPMVLLNPQTHPLDGNTGIHNLRDQVNQIHQMGLGPTRIPIVLVPGFSGWGRPLLGTVNYFGGFEDLALGLSTLGYVVIVVRIGPISSNRDRACEIYAQLYNINRSGPGGFDLPGALATLIPVNFGRNHPAFDAANPAYPALLDNAKTWQAVVYNPPAAANQLSPAWTWSAENKVHFICHSQGGTTIRYLIEILRGVNPDFDAIIPGNRQNWVKSVVTLGTPHKGTTVTEVVENVLPPGLDPLVDFVTSCSFESRPNRVYDLHLDHWGISRNGQESYGQMRARIANNVTGWWNGRNHGFGDNSLLGAVALNAYAPSPDTYYFTMSFCATVPFPNVTLTAGQVNGFLDLIPVLRYLNTGGIFGKVLAPILRTAIRSGALPQARAVLTWVTTVANYHLGNLGYFAQIPLPGLHIPRPDVLPLLSFPAYAMGGLNTPPPGILGMMADQLKPNDGIVNTESMNGPVAGPIMDGTNFAAQLQDAIAANDLSLVRGRYWHLHSNSTIDHADQIGVFTNPATVSFYPL